MRTKINWSTVKGRILNAEAVQPVCHGVKSKQYQAQAGYEYSVLGQYFSKVEVIPKSHGDLNYTQGFVNKYKAGQEIDVNRF